MAVLVVIRNEKDSAAWVAALANEGLAWSGFDAFPRIFRVDWQSAATFPLKDHPLIETAEDERMVRPASDQAISLDNALSGGSWGIARIIRRSAPWPTGRLQFPRDTYFRCKRDGAGVDIYIVDTGVLTTHDEFSGRATSVYDPFGTSLYFHGTFVASLIGGSTIGLARGALIWSCRWADSSGSGTDTNVINALSQALSHYNGRSGTGRPAVVNLSLSGSGSAVNTAVSNLIAAGMVVCAAAGNDRTDLGTISEYPAESDADNIVVGAVGAADIPYYIDASGTLFGTNWGSRVDIVAPGQNTYAATTTGDSDYELRTGGTSYSCGFTSGAVACLLQGHSRLTSRTQVQAVKQALLARATTGKVTLPGGFGITTLPDKLLYLDPDQAAPESISGI